MLLIIFSAAMDGRDHRAQGEKMFVWYCSLMLKKVLPKKEQSKPVLHVLPLNKPQLLRCWLASLKLHNLSVGPGRRACSDHFSWSGYQEKGDLMSVGRLFTAPQTG